MLTTRQSYGCAGELRGRLLEAFCRVFEAGDLDALLGGYYSSASAEAFARKVSNEAGSPGEFQWLEGIVEMPRTC
jgi:hypothetical protein